MPLPPLPFPEVPAEQRSETEFRLRYADVDQHGALKFEALPLAVERCGWDRVMRSGEAMEQLSREEQLLAILTRFHIRCGGGPVSVNAPVVADGAYEWTHTKDETGGTNRVMFNIYARLMGRVGSTHPPPPEGAGEPVELGQIVAEHVFTRPFAPSGKRRVAKLPEGGQLPTVPAHETRWVIPSTIARPPINARRLDREPVLGRRFVFGLTHTDSNRHVNSLVYPRVFEEIALERLFEHGVSTSDLLLTELEITYRKPCFAGQRMEVMVQAVRSGDRYGAVGSFVPIDTDDRRPHCYLRIWF